MGERSRQEEDDYSGYRVDNQFRWLKLGRSFIPIKTSPRCNGCSLVCRFSTFRSACIDNGFIVKAQLVVAACFAETGVNREGRGKGEEDGGRQRAEKKAWKQRGSRLHTNESGLSSPAISTRNCRKKKNPEQ